MKTNAITVLIDTDEETVIPCRVEYNYQEYLLRDAKVADVHYEQINGTDTPEYIIAQQIENAICSLHGQVEFI